MAGALARRGIAYSISLRGACDQAAAVPNECFGVFWICGQELFARFHSAVESRFVAHHAGKKIVAHQHVETIRVRVLGFLR